MGCKHYLVYVWEKYKVCWKKADILHITLITDINETFGSTSFSKMNKMVSNELWHLIINVKIRETKSVHNTIAVSKNGVLYDSFTTDKNLPPNDMKTIVVTWVCSIEDDNAMKTAIINDKLDQL